MLHGFILAGGKSSRMGQDKALLPFGGVPMVQIAVEKLRSFCADVAIVGERQDLAAFAPIVAGEREGVGPAAGIEAGLRACRQPWAIFLPIDVPLVPGEMLRRWAEDLIARNSTAGEYLVADGRPQSAFCLLPKSALTPWSEGIAAGERRLDALLLRTGASARSVDSLAWVADPAKVHDWFQNVNTPEDLREACNGVLKVS